LHTTGGADLDAEEQSSARSVAEEKALRAGEHGNNATPIIKESFEGIPKAILVTAAELSARSIVCGQRKRSIVRSALLGSVSDSPAPFARRPILIAPERAVDSK
jgi:nucleotide-binding universal stress UspA family protein